MFAFHKYYYGKIISSPSTQGKTRFKDYKYFLSHPSKRLKFLHLKDINSIQEQLYF